MRKNSFFGSKKEKREKQKAKFESKKEKREKQKAKFESKKAKNLKLYCFTIDSLKS